MTKRKIIISAIITLIGLTLIIGGYFIYLINDLGDKVNENGTSNPIGITDFFITSFREPLTVLVLGVDARDEQLIEETRSDTIMLVTLNPITRQVAAVSFPRDTYVLINDIGYTKLNHAMAYGGVPLLKETIESNFGIPIDNYVAMDFVAFEKIVDQLGGLEIDVEKRMYYKSGDINVNLQPGLQQMDGQTLLGYVRWRNDSEGDLGRIERQQEAIEGLGEKATSLAALANINEMLDILGEHIKTDMTTQELLDITKKYSNFSKEDWHSMTLGGESARSGEDNLWYYFYSDENKEELLSFIETYRDANIN